MKLDWIEDFLNFCKKYAQILTQSQSHWSRNCFTQGNGPFKKSVFPPGHYPARVFLQGRIMPGRTKKCSRYGTFSRIQRIFPHFFKNSLGCRSVVPCAWFFGHLFSFFVSRTSRTKDQGIIPASCLARSMRKIRCSYHIASYGLLREWMKRGKRKYSTIWALNREITKI